LIVSVLFLGLLMASCQGGERKREEAAVVLSYEKPAWSKDAVLYELNVRQFSDEGTFSAVEGRVDDLAELGVDVIWFMPIHPIGMVNRKGPLGSYYSIKDFRDVNPEFGTIGDFKSLVNSIHDAGMYVMMDWVPNHSSWDNQLAEEHPDWYVKDSTGSFVSPYDWTDVIQFDWSSEGLQEYMMDALLYWVEDIDVDCAAATALLSKPTMGNVPPASSWRKLLKWSRCFHDWAKNKVIPSGRSQRHTPLGIGSTRGEAAVPQIRRLII